MAFDTKDWRRIVIEDQVYYWQRAEWLDLFHVRPEREPHRLLRVRCSRCSDGWCPRNVTPGVVRCGIECAIKDAWFGERPQLRLIVFSDPLRYVSLQQHWLTSTVVALATNIYSDNAFDRMPILADALQDAGCTNEDILSHCRNANQVHVRGCWVVDLLLGKS